MNYYIIGSKYGNQSSGFDDILPLMLKKGVIATGFNWHEDMQEFVGKTHEVIITHLKEKAESKESYYTLKHFLNLKPGDLVAVKIHSAPSGKQARLVIGAYAIVKGVDFPVYKHCDELGHTIEVDFIETGLDYELPFGYGQTIHKVEDLERIKPIFGYYSYEVAKPESEGSQLHLKNTDDVIVEATAGYVSSRAHNKIQNLLADELVETHGLECVKVEKNFIDVLVELEDKFILYEVKSYLSSDRCIREALGQVLQYGHFLKARSGKAVEYVVVGPSNVDDSEDSYYTYISNTLKETFTYKRVFA
ncbi:TPA: hypothetical protein NJ598_003020 [Vibrio parahaemolyticus]|nr:hypothetical protein [Vibrio parahaemolyticus]